MKQIVFLLFVITIGVSCNKSDEAKTPIKISICGYSLADTPCQWVNVGYDSTVVVINDQTELAKYINCTEGNYPDVDFSKYTLLLASGVAAGGIADIDTVLFKNNTNKYTLTVTIHLDFTAIGGQSWCIPILMPKISNKDIIALDVYQTH